MSAGWGVTLLVVVLLVFGLAELWRLSRPTLHRLRMKRMRDRRRGVLPGHLAIYDLPLDEIRRSCSPLDIRDRLDRVTSAMNMTDDPKVLGALRDVASVYVAAQIVRMVEGEDHANA